MSLSPSKRTKLSFDSLSDDAWIHILSYLSSKHAILRLSLLNHHFLQLVYAHLYSIELASSRGWIALNPFLEGIQRLRVLTVSDEVLKMLPSAPKSFFASLATLKVTSTRCQYKEEMMNLLRALQVEHLQNLRINFAPMIHLKEILSMFPRLKSIHSNQIDASGLSAEELQYLEEITCSRLTCSEPWERASLRAFHIGSFYYLEPMQMEELLDKILIPCASTLRVLGCHMSNFRLDSCELSKFRHLTALKEITLRGFDKENVIHILSDLNALEKIIVRSWADNMIDIPASALLRHQDSLKYLSMGEISDVSQLDAFKCDFPKLEVLNCGLGPEDASMLKQYPFIRECHLTTPEKRGQSFEVQSSSLEVCELASKLPIKELDINAPRLRSVNVDWGIAKIRGMNLHSERLTEFDVGSNASVTMDVMHFDCPNLRIFRLNVKSKKFQKLSIKHSGSLTTFVVSSHVVPKLVDAEDTLRNVTVAGFSGHCYPSAPSDFKVFAQCKQLHTFLFHSTDLKELKPMKGTVESLNHVTLLSLHTVLHVPLDTMDEIFPNVRTLELMDFSLKSCPSGHLITQLTERFKNVQNLTCNFLAPHLKSTVVEQLLKVRQIPHISITERNVKTSTLRISNSTVTHLALAGFPWSKIESLPAVTHLELHSFKRKSELDPALLKEFDKVNPQLERLKLYVEWNSMKKCEKFVEALRKKFTKLHFLCMESTLSPGNAEELALIKKLREDNFLLVLMHENDFMARSYHHLWMRKHYTNLLYSDAVDEPPTDDRD